MTTAAHIDRIYKAAFDFSAEEYKQKQAAQRSKQQEQNTRPAENTITLGKPAEIVLVNDLTANSSAAKPFPSMIKLSECEFDYEAAFGQPVVILSPKKEKKLKPSKTVKQTNDQTKQPSPPSPSQLADPEWFNHPVLLPPLPIALNLPHALLGDDSKLEMSPDSIIDLELPSLSILPDPALLPPIDGWKSDGMVNENAKAHREEGVERFGREVQVIRMSHISDSPKKKNADVVTEVASPKNHWETKVRHLPLPPPDSSYRLAAANQSLADLLNYDFAVSTSDSRSSRTLKSSQSTVLNRSSSRPNFSSWRTLHGSISQSTLPQDYYGNSQVEAFW